jgi:hypothetical protein
MDTLSPWACSSEADRWDIPASLCMQPDRCSLRSPTRHKRIELIGGFSEAMSAWFCLCMRHRLRYCFRL